jgi:phospholipase C
MPYPIKMQGQAIAPGQSFSVTFRPLAAGLVNATVDALGLQPPPNGDGGNGGGSGHPPPARRPVPYRVGLKLEVFKPGAANAVASSIGGPVTVPPASNRLFVWADTPAAAIDLAADWTARVTNTGSSSANYTVTVRYQVAPGNLGKIDHIVVLMMENRSFDHMLGYLRLQAGRTDVDGLTGTESNNDDSGNPVVVHPLATDGRANPTFFANDPGHGWNDVGEQLGTVVIQPTPMEGPPTAPRAGDAVEPRVPLPPAPHNDGFVRNFAKQLAIAAQDLPPQMGSVNDEGDIAGGDSSFVFFRPLAPGRVSVFSIPKSQPRRSETGLLAELVLRRPGLNKPLKDVKASLGARSIGTSYLATAADLATAGDWTCEVKNWTEVNITFTSGASFVVAEHDTRGQEPAGAIMGYYDASQLRVYDMFAREFAICNRWFASLPTDTWPNRLYSLTGGSGGMITTPSTGTVPSDPPGYTLTTIFEVLQARGIDWMNYFSDLPFALIFKRLVQDASYTRRMRSLTDLLAAAHTGDLPSMAWLDPNFTDVETSVGEPAAANDDHPPGDVARGQALVRQIYQALSQGPGWSKTLLIVTYDEHGGFYDHVLPPGTPVGFPPQASAGPPDDDPNLRRYGVRVPAFIVSPWVPRGSVVSDAFDHTSLIATVLRRFCAAPVPSMGARADNALDVGSLLSLDVPRPPPPPPPAPAAGPRAVMLPTTFGAVLRKSLFGF